MEMSLVDVTEDWLYTFPYMRLGIGCQPMINHGWKWDVEMMMINWCVGYDFKLICYRPEIDS